MNKKGWSTGIFYAAGVIAMAAGTTRVSAEDLKKADPNDPIIGVWMLPGYAFRIFHPDGSSTNGNGARDASWWCQSATKTPRRYTIQFSQELKFDLEFNPDSKALVWERWEKEQWKYIPASRISAIPTPSDPETTAPTGKAKGDQTVLVSGSCPGGTNFGTGGTTRKLYGSVSTASEKPLPVTVECYWVMWDGKNRSATRFATKSETISSSKAFKFEEADDNWQRTNGGTNGTIGSSYKGEFRGWVIAVRGADGRKLGTAAANPEFHRLVP